MSETKPPLDPNLKALESEAIHIFREVAAEFERPVMLYSVGKDSSEPERKVFERYQWFVIQRL